MRAGTAFALSLGGRSWRKRGAKTASTNATLLSFGAGWFAMPNWTENCLDGVLDGTCC